MSELLRFTAGDLSQRAAAEMQSHLRGCSACATHLHSWDQTLEAYRRHVPGASEGLPQWEGFDTALLREEEKWQRDRTTRTRRQWAAAAAIAAMLLGTAWFWQRSEVVLNAEEVITRAVRHEQENPSSSAAAVWIRETQATAVRAAASATHVKTNGDRSNDASEIVSNRGRVAQELATRLAAYGFNWAAPLSAQPLQRWRAAAERAEDRVLLIDPTLLKLSMTSAAGAIRQAEIVVRQHTYEPVSQHWRFEDGFSAELTTVRPDEPSMAAPPVIVATAPEVVKPAAPRIDMEAIELDLRSTLQRLGAPVGSALTIRQGRGGIRVEGTVETAESARQIAAYARGRPFVDARVIVAPVGADRDVAVSPGLRAWLDQVLWNDDVRETFVGRTWKLLDRLQISINALDELGRRYDKDRAAALSPDGQQMLTDLAVRQYSEVTARYEALERHLAPLIGTISRPVMPSELPADWRRVGGTANEGIHKLSSGLEEALGESQMATTPESIAQLARDLLRPALESLAGAVASP